MAPEAAPTTAAEPLPARRAGVYSRTYSYFSHRVFVAYLPPDLHRYLAGLFDVSEATPGEKQDAEVLRWVLLHRSQLNALALNRLVESWRAEGDVLRLPRDAELRSDPVFRTDLTMQMAIEVELGGIEDSWWLQNRPRLLLRALDAAYYVSRQREAADTSRARRDPAGPEAAPPVLDLSDGSGRQAFVDDLVRRMNLHDDQPASGATPATAADEPRLPEDEVDWLLSIARGVARALSTPRDAGTWRDLWNNRCSRAWKDAGLKEAPDQAVFDALLGTPADGGAEELVLAAQGPEEHWRFTWKATPERETTRQVLLGVKRELTFITAVEKTLADVLSGADGKSGADTPGLHAVARGGAESPLLALSERYGLLPTTPGWNRAARAIEGVKLALGGAGHASTLQADVRIVEDYAALLRQPAAARTVARALTLASALLATQPTPATPSLATEIPLPAPDRLAAALQVLHDGLALHKCPQAEAEARLQEAARQWKAAGGQELPLPPALASTRDAPLPAWPGADALRAAMQGFKAPTGTDWPALAWRHRVAREVQRGPSTIPPAAHVAELVCALRGDGPARVLPLAQGTAGLREWTRVLLEAVQGATARGAAPAGREHSAPLLALALDRLGAGALTPLVLQALLAALENASSGLWQAVATQAQALGLWTGPRSQARVALVLGPAESALTRGWPLPPRSGLVLAASVDDFDDLRKHVLDAGLPAFTEPLLLAWEPSAPGTPDRRRDITRSLPATAGGPLQALYLYPAGQGGTDVPARSGVASADDLWAGAPSA